MTLQSTMTGAGRWIQTAAQESQATRKALLEGQHWGKDAFDIAQILSAQDAQVQKSAAPAITVAGLPTNQIVQSLVTSLQRYSAMQRLVGVRYAPVASHLVGVGTKPVATLVGEGAASPIAGIGFADAYLPPRKISVIVPFTDAAMRSVSAAGQQSIAEVLVKAVARRADQEFMTTAGIPEVASSGSAPAAIDADISAALTMLDAAGADLTDLQILISSRLAARLIQLRGSSGLPSYADLTMAGGFISGIPVLVSGADPVSAATHDMLIVNGQGVVLSDPRADAIEVSRSRVTALQMLDNPTSNAATATPQQMVSMFQTDSVAMKATWFVSWYIEPSSACRITGMSP